MKGKSEAKKKDDRSYLQRLRLAMLTGFAVVFTFILFGMLDLYFANADIFEFGFFDLLWPALGTALLCFAVASPLLALFRGKYFDFFQLSHFYCPSVFFSPFLVPIHQYFGIVFLKIMPKIRLLHLMLWQFLSDF